MKTIEELKNEQYDLKAKLHEIIEFMNGKEYFSLSDTEKCLAHQCKFGVELYLDALTSMIYGVSESSFEVEVKPAKKSRRRTHE